MSISQYSPDGKFESGSFMNGMWSGPQGTNPNQGQGLMGLGQQPQGDSLPGTASFQTGYGQPQQGFNPQGAMGLPMFDRGFAPYNPQNTLGQQPNIQEEYGVPSPFMNQSPMPQYQLGYNPPVIDNIRQPQGNMPQGNMPPIGRPLGRFIPATTLPDGTRNSEGGSYEYPQQPQAKPLQSFFEGPTKGQIPMGFNMVDGEMVKTGNFNERLPTPQPPQFFQPQPMQQPMQAPSNPVNTQTVQPNFMGQTPFGQPQTGQFNSTNPFVQAAQANAQGNIAGALQATAANRINQQTPYGSLSY